MADIKNIQVDGIDYAIKDETARNSIGDLSRLATNANQDLVSAVNELATSTGSGGGAIQRIESLDESNLKNLRDLESGSYVLYGYFRPYAGASVILPFDNLLVNVYHVAERSHLFEFSTANSEIHFIEILVDSNADDGFTYSRTPINMLEMYAILESVVFDSSMDTNYVDFDQNIKAINHRGYSTYAPENTLPAYLLSRKRGFTYVEADISFTSDGVAVLLHDSTIDRTSDGSGSISEMTYDQASQYDYGSWKSNDYVGTKIPTFEEFLKLCKNLCLHPYIELKSNGAYTEQQIKTLVTTVKKYGMRGKVTWISFSSNFLSYVKSADSAARLGYLVTSITSDIITTAQGLKTDQNEVFIDSSDYDAQAVELCCNADIPLEVWTINSGYTIQNLDPYITGVTSDNLLAGRILYNAAEEVCITDMLVDINMNDNGINSTGDATYNATISNGGTFDGNTEYGDGKFVVNGKGALTIPTDFMDGTEPWTIAFTIDSYTVDSSNAFCRVARGGKDVPSVFAIGSTGKFMFKMASRTVFASDSEWYDSDFLTPNEGVGTHTALTFTRPANEKTTYAFCNDGTYITFWVNGAMKVKQKASAYTSTYYASTFSIGDNAGVGYDMASMKCSMLKAWDRALSAAEIAML